MKRSELFFGAVLVPIDFLAILAAGALAYYLRLSPTIQSVRPAVFQLDLRFFQYMQLVAIVGLAIIAIFAWQGLYVMQATRRPMFELTRIFTGLSAGVMLIIVYMFLSAGLFQSRFILLAAYVFAMTLIVSARFLIRRVQLLLLQRGFGVHRVALVGNGRYGAQLAALFAQRPALGYSVVGIPEEARLSLLEQIRRKHGIDEVIQTNPSMTEEDNLVLLDFCDRYKIDYKYIPNIFEAYAANVHFRQIGGVPVMELLRTPLDGWGRVAKRAVDIIGAITGLTLLSPILIAAAAAIKLNSRGPILYSQTRIGRNREPFKIYKFRSMYIECCLGNEYGGKKAKALDEKLRQNTNERSGPLFKMKNDPRITPVGRFIRKTRVDELPQFLNVLKGDMSLLGPRPHLPNEVDRYNKHHQKLFTIKPGMSGMAQVNGNAGLGFEQEASLDITYVEQWSLRLDIILLLKTFALLLKDRNAV